jgi:hypothetical protein
MGCSCKNNNKPQNNKPLQNITVQNAVKQTIEKYYNKNKK